MRNYFSVCFSNTQDKRWSKACICGNKFNQTKNNPKFHKNLRSNFRKFLLIS
ncbi:alpha-mannosidase [Enterococcus faecium]|nr:alpha-mannosidase [Enterococcus faecium]